MNQIIEALGLFLETGGSTLPEGIANSPSVGLIEDDLEIWNGVLNPDSSLTFFFINQ